MRLLKYRASMRFDDLMWLDLDSVLMLEAGMEATMSQSKTSNKLRKADALKIFVSTAPFFSEKTWLMEGEKDWRGACVGSLFMFPLPNADLESVKEKPVRYREASALSQALLASLTYQDGGCAGEKGEGTLLLSEGAGAFYTEHSERNAMISFAAALGNPKDLQERLGRWKGDSSELYVRTSKTVVMAFQQEVADIIRMRDVDCLGDAEALQALKDYVLKKGVIGSDLGHLKWFKGASTAAENPFEEPEVPPIVSPVGYVVCVPKRNGVRRLHHTSLCATFQVQLHLQQLCLLRQ